MWPRLVEVMLGLWLIIGPLVFRVPADDRGTWAAALGAGAVVLVLALVSLWHRTRRAHLFTIGVALALALGASLQGRPPPPIHQSHIAVALLLLLHAILPTETNQPPKPWRQPPPGARSTGH